MTRVRSKREGRQYAAIPNAAMRDKAVSLEARGMLALMMGYSDDWVFYRSHLMDVAGIGREKFQRIMAELQAAGYVTRETLRGPGGHVAGTTYVIHDDPSASTEGLKTRLSAEGLKNRPPVEPTAGKPGPIRKPDSEALPTKEEDQTLSHDLFSASGETEKLGTTDELFDEFWSLYPRRPNESKKDARAKFRIALRKVSWETLRAAVVAYAASRKGEDPRYTAMAETWLNKERWQGWVGKPSTGRPRMNPDNPMEGIPEHIAQVIRYEIDPEERDKDARAWWARQEAAE